MKGKSRRASLFLILALVGCGKSKPIPPDTGTQPTLPPKIIVPASLSGGAAFVKQLRLTRGEAQYQLIEQCEAKAASDPELIPALLEGLTDKSTRGETVISSGPGSNREAIVLALLACGPAGEQAAVEKALPTLLTSLADPSAAVRGHAAISIGRMGSRAKSAIDKLWPLAADPIAFVRDSALIAIKEIGAPSPLPLIQLLSHADPDVRRTAGQHLSEFKPIPKDAVPALAKALDTADKSTRTYLIELLGEFGADAEPAIPAVVQLLKTVAQEYDPTRPDGLDVGPVFLLASIGKPAVDPLVALLADRNSVVRFVAVYALAELGPVAKPALAEVEKRLMDRSGEVALEAARALAAISGDATRSTALMKAALTHEEATTRIYGLQVLLRMGQPGQALAKLALPLLEDRETRIRELAVEFLATLPIEVTREVLPKLLKYLTMDDEPVRLRLKVVNLVADLGAEGQPAISDLVLVATSDEDEDLRAAGMAAIRGFGSQASAAVPRLLKHAADPNLQQDIRISILATLTEIAPEDLEVAQLVARSLSDKAEPVRAQAMLAAPQVKHLPPATIPTLGQIATSDLSFPARIKAMRALAELGPAAASIREKIAPSASDSIIELAFWAKLAVARIDNNSTEVAKIIRAGLTSRRYAERNAAVHTVGRILTPAETDIPALVAISRDRTSTVRLSAVLAMARSRRVAKPAQARLVDMLKDREPEVRIAAIQALVAIGADATARPALTEATRFDPPTARAARIALRELAAKN